MAAAEIGQLHLIASVAIAHPDFAATAAVRDKGNAVPIRRKLRARFLACRSDELAWLTCWHSRERARRAPNIVVCLAIKISQSFSGARDGWLMGIFANPDQTPQPSPCSLNSPKRGQAAAC